MKMMAQSCRFRVFFFSPMKNKRQLDHGHFLSSILIGATFKGRTTPFYAFGFLKNVENSINGLLVCLFISCCSFVNVDPFKRLVFVLFDFGRTCFALF
jgi:hypothetical protein